MTSKEAVLDAELCIVPWPLYLSSLSIHFGSRGPREKAVKDWDKALKELGNAMLSTVSSQ